VELLERIACTLVSAGFQREPPQCVLASETQAIKLAMLWCGWSGTAYPSPCMRWRLRPKGLPVEPCVISPRGCFSCPALHAYLTWLCLKCRECGGQPATNLATWRGTEHKSSFLSLQVWCKPQLHANCCGGCEPTHLPYWLREEVDFIDCCLASSCPVLGACTCTFIILASVYHQWTHVHRFVVAPFPDLCLAYYFVLVSILQVPWHASCCMPC